MWHAWGKEDVFRGFLLVYRKVRDHWEDIDTVGLDNNIKIDLREIGIDGVIWIQQAEDRFQLRAFVNTVMNFRVP
jgi:hypothetical protein